MHCSAGCSKGTIPVINAQPIVLVERYLFNWQVTSLFKHRSRKRGHCVLVCGATWWSMSLYNSKYPEQCCCAERWRCCGNTGLTTYSNRNRLHLPWYIHTSIKITWNREIKNERMNERDLTIQYNIHIWVRIRLYWDSLGVFVYCNSKPDLCILWSLSFSTTFSQKIWTWKNWGKHIDFCSENICIALLDKYYNIMICWYLSFITCLLYHL